jgi:hypothetical protein
MNLSLTQTYVAKKVAARYPELNFARETMAKTDYQSMVLSIKAQDISPDVLSSIKSVLVKRFDLKEHQMLFRNPNLKQWVVDVLGVYTSEDILTFFSQRSGVSKERIASATIGDNLLDRNFLIFLVEHLESITGKFLCNDNDILHPLMYLGDDTRYTELCSFFSHSGSPEIELKKKDSGVL